MAISSNVVNSFYVQSFDVISIVHPSHNYVDPVTQINTIAGGGSPTYPNKIGVNALPVGTEAETHGGWAVDAAYPSDGTAATVATIGGGRNHVNNQIAGTIGGGDSNYIPYSGTGHATIAGGKLNYNIGGYSFIGGGLRNAHGGTGNPQLSVILGGQENLNQEWFPVIGGGQENQILGTGLGPGSGGGSLNTIGGGYQNVIQANVFYAFIGGGYSNAVTDSDYATIGGGRDNAITNSDYSTVGGGQNNTVTGGAASFIGGGLGNTLTASYGFIGGGDGNTVSGDYSAITSGLNCTVSGNYAMSWGNTNSASHDYSLVFGQEQVSWAPVSINFGGEKLVTAGDNGVCIQQDGLRTSDVVPSELLHATLPAKYIAANVTIRLVATKDGSADGNNDGDYSFAVYEREIGLYWDGSTNGYLYDAAGNSGLGATPVLAMNKRAGNAAVDYTPSSVQAVIKSGIFHLEVVGSLATFVNWNASAEWLLLKVE